MVDTVTLGSNDVYVSGRFNTPKPDQERVEITARMDFSSAASYVVDFTVINQPVVIGIIRSMFCDNTNGTNEIVVNVSGTQQRFTIPAGAQGIFTINATEASKITLTSAGGSAGITNMTFYNYTQYPYVWYKSGNNPNSGIQKVQGTNAEGTVIATNLNNFPVYIAGKSPTGTLVPVNVSTTGNQLSDVQGILARDAPQTANPLVVGGRASNATPASVSADGDVVDAWYSRVGSAVIATSHQGAFSFTSTFTGNNVFGDLAGAGRPIAVSQQLAITSGSCISAFTVGGANNTQGVGVQATGMPLWSTPDFTRQRINQSAAGDTVLVAAVVGQSTRVYSMRLIVAAATVLQIKTGAGTVLEEFPLAAFGSVYLDLRDRPYYNTINNQSLILNSSNAVSVQGMLEFVTSA